MAVRLKSQRLKSLQFVLRFLQACSADLEAMWGRGLARERVGARKFGMSTKLLGGMSRDVSPDVPGVPKNQGTPKVTDLR